MTNLLNITTEQEASEVIGTFLNFDIKECIVLGKKFRLQRDKDWVQVDVLDTSISDKIICRSIYTTSVYYSFIKENIKDQIDEFRSNK